MCRTPMEDYTQGWAGKFNVGIEKCGVDWAELVIHVKAERGMFNEYGEEKAPKRPLSEVVRSANFKWKVLRVIAFLSLPVCIAGFVYQIFFTEDAPYLVSVSIGLGVSLFAFFMAWKLPENMAWKLPENLKKAREAREDAIWADQARARVFENPVRSSSSATPGVHREVKGRRGLGILYQCLGSGLLALGAVLLVSYALADSGDYTQLIGRFGGPICIASGLGLLRAGQRHRVVDASRVLATDRRAPVLYLRAFDDDDVAEKAVGSRNLFGFQFGLEATEEQQIAEVAGRVGPLVAVGRPADDHAMVGAARMYLADDEWQGRVLGLLDTCAFVILRAGPSEGFWWEVQHVLERVPPEKVVILLPFGPHTYTAFAERMNKLLPEPLPADPGSMGLVGGTLRGVVWFSAGWVPHLEAGRRKGELYIPGSGAPVAAFLEYMLPGFFEQMGAAHATLKNATFRRMLAALLDMVGVLTMMFLGSVIWPIVMIAVVVYLHVTSLAALRIVPWAVYFAMIFFYFCVGDLRLWGRSPGKLALRVQVVDGQREALSLRARVLRCVVKSLWISTIPMMFGDHGWMSPVAAVVFAIPTVWALYALVATTRRRLAHDHLSASYVVRRRPVEKASKVPKSAVQA